MNKIIHLGASYFDKLFSGKSLRSIELIILRIALISFLIHLALIYLANNYNYFVASEHNYLKAIYTPFSFILFYEVLLLVVIIPKSISEFIGKQFEVITLITLRSFFHDIADFNFRNTFQITNTEITSILYDLIASLLMLALTMIYYKIYLKNNKKDKINDLANFINIKKLVSIGMIIILFILSIGAFYEWINDMIIALRIDKNYPNPNTVFYTDFFTIMIFVDVMLLLISFIYHFSFFTIFRNASFIITTILIRMSLTIEKPMNHLIVLAGFIFAIASFYLYNLRNTEALKN